MQLLVTHSGTQLQSRPQNRLFHISTHEHVADQGLSQSRLQTILHYLSYCLYLSQPLSVPLLVSISNQLIFIVVKLLYYQHHLLSRVSFNLKTPFFMEKQCSEKSVDTLCRVPPCNNWVKNPVINFEHKRSVGCCPVI